MAIADRWDEVHRAWGRLDQYRVLHPTLIAMRRLTAMVQDDPAFADAQPVVSHASLTLMRSWTGRRVMAAWNEGVYHIAFVDPQMEISESTRAGEDVVLRVLREYFDRLDAP